MGLFSKRRTQEYNGFAKYVDEYLRHSNYNHNANATSNQGHTLQRTQSLTSASHAAMAALQMHQKPHPFASVQHDLQPQNRQNYRANSLGSYRRSNSMQSYTYTPKPSYMAGPLQQQLHRTHSLQSNNSLVGSIRLGPRRKYLAQAVFPEEAEIEHGFNDGEDVIITTKTTKVIDSLGRTKSITTETVRQMADGSNVIETRTTNLLRAGSRANSLQDPPLAHLQHTNSYNLNTIDEDLHDFDYTYLDHAPPLSGNESFMPPRSHLVLAEAKNTVPLSSVRREFRTSSMSSLQSPKGLKSILKSNSGAANPAAAVSGSSNDNPSPHNSAHNSAHNSPHVSPPISASNGGHILEKEPEHLEQAPAAFRKLQSAPAFEPNHRLASLTSGGNSIKFLNKVETIPYNNTYNNTHTNTYSENYKEISNDEEHKKQQDMQNNVDLFSKALQVAAEKVYGSSHAGEEQPLAHAVDEGPRSDLVQRFAEKKSKKLKSDKNRSKVEASGVSKNYVYTNHYKNFSVRSLRNTGKEHHSSRKERAKEEKRKLKDEEKEHVEAVELQSKHEEKEGKDAKKLEKKSLFPLFKRNRRRESVGDFSIRSLEAKHAKPNEKENLGAKIDHVQVSSGDQIPVADTAHEDRTQPLSEENNLSVASNISALPDANASGENQENGSLAEPPQTSTSVIRSENGYQLGSSLSLDDEDDEFVDVPENVVEERVQRVSGIPVLEHENPAKTDNGVSLEFVEGTMPVCGSIVADLKSVEWSQIPERGDLVHQPNSLLAEGNVPDSPLGEKFARNLSTQPQDLPTLVSGVNGAPQVLTTTDHYTSRPTFVEESNEDSLANTRDSTYEDAKSEVVVVDEKEGRIEPLPALGLVSQPSHEKAHLPSKPPLNDVQQSSQDESGAFSNGKKMSLEDVEDDSGVAIDGVAHIETERKRLDSNAKAKTQKKASKFKKVMEKYFLSRYTR